ncbi:uncharacterized protein OCT59_002017 [Rhizophagus irregularis]|uniref:Uncharacterized protein n=3 Tax=Rhizophagus irregularis TaxID=588596 RepID=A0A015LW14_RHIIW|nr:hypothetical protein RirG_028780 [Rhizophagus irregularis DAOM 197198w]UZO10435.1 hypothetical protein OCT59_002017 [Rhizophagus irregularis]GBC47399.1 hypothetical protein GLOIN_2v1574152 [Rhizophagus irregularis DAOM 181602=DAOM 197198]
MASSRTSFYPTVVIFIIISCILCQFVASIPVLPRIALQSHDNEVTIKISTGHHICGKVSSDAYKADKSLTYNTYKVHDATTESNTLYDQLSNISSNIRNYLAEHHVAIIIGAIIIAVLAVLMIFPPLITGLIRCIGFGVGGIVKGSCAAMIMASRSGKVAVNSACAVLQSAGELGVKGFGGLIKLFLRLIKCC